MRPVKGGKGASKGGKRGHAAAHKPEPRVKRRIEPEAHSSFDPEGTLQRLRESFPFRHPMLSLTLGLVVVGLVGGIFAGGYIGRAETNASQTVHGALADAGFAVRAVELAGNDRTSEEDAYAAIDVVPGRSIFAIDPGLARRKLMALPWVADAEVRRQLPDTLSVRLIEKRPFALWRDKKGIAVVERNGAVITREPEEQFHLPIIVGAGAPEAAAPFIDALGGFKAVNARVKMIERVGERRWDLLLDTGVTAKLPEEGWETQLGELERLITGKKVLDRDIEIIDLRYPDHLIFRLHNGDSRTASRPQRA
jgi:cell division protein FtsQ